MTTLERISKPVDDLIKAYNQYVSERILIEDETSSRMLKYIFDNKGKGIRPMLALLSSSMFGCDSSQTKERVFLSAMIIEMVHTASLIHDDIIDEAYIRRGKPSVNALWGQKRAVLMGDFIFAKSYALGMNSHHFDLMEPLAQAMTQICEGELLQDVQSRSLSMTRDVYNKIIFGKTASLISTAAHLGAKSAYASEQDQQNMSLFGKNLGMAFQIKDDILDFSIKNNTGKLGCNDLKERKITMPLLAVMENSTPALRKEIIRLLSSVNSSPSKVYTLYEIVVNEGGLDKAAEVLATYQSKCLEILSLYPEGEYRQSLELLCEFMASRNK